MNGGYHYDEDIERNLLGPLTDDGCGRRQGCNARKPRHGHAHYTRCYRFELASMELQLDQSTPPELVSLANARRRSLSGSNSKDAVGRVLERGTEEREEERA